MDAETKRRVDEMWDQARHSAARSGDRQRETGHGERRPPVRTAAARPRRPDLRRRVARSSAMSTSSSCPTRSSRCRSRCWACSPRPAGRAGDRADRSPGRAGLLRGALGGDGLQPDRRPRFRCAEPPDREPRAAPRRAHAGQAWVSVLAAAALFMLAAGAAQPALSSAESPGARLDPDLQPDQAIHLVAAPLAGPQPGDRAGRRIPRGDGPVERAGLAAARHDLAVATWVAGFDIFYALPDEGFDRREGLRSAVVRLGEPRAILLAKLLHGITIPALALFGYGAGFGALVLRRAWSRRRRSWPTSTSLVRPGDLSRLDAAFFTMNGVMSRDRFRLRAGRPSRVSADAVAARNPPGPSPSPRPLPATGRHPATASEAPGAVAHAQPEGPVSRLPSCSRSPAPPARRTGCGCSRCWRATGSRSGSSPRATAAACCSRVRDRERWTPCARPRAADWSRASRVFPDGDRGALPASGSQRTAGMVICPCSMGTVAAVAAGTSRSLVERAADVTLKERRKLILVPRETPLSLVHLRNLVAVAEAGAVVIPAAPGFYHRPTRWRAGGLHRAAGARPARPGDRLRPALDRRRPGESVGGAGAAGAAPRGLRGR